MCHMRGRLQSDTNMCPMRRRIHVPGCCMYERKTPIRHQHDLERPAAYLRKDSNMRNMFSVKRDLVSVKRDLISVKRDLVNVTSSILEEGHQHDALNMMH